jgi:hypothetical protein
MHGASRRDGGVVQRNDRQPVGVELLDGVAGGSAATNGLEFELGDRSAGHTECGDLGVVSYRSGRRYRLLLHAGEQHRRRTVTKLLP